MNEEECIFCKIVRGELPSDSVFETAEILTIVNLHPNTFGHCLVIPKVHYPDIYSMPDELVAVVFQEAKRAAVATKSAMKADGVNVYMNNGEASGQEIFHAHIHVIPRFANDGFRTFPTKTYEYDGHKKEIAERIREKL